MNGFNVLFQPIFVYEWSITHVAFGTFMRLLKHFGIHILHIKIRNKFVKIVGQGKLAIESPGLTSARCTDWTWFSTLVREMNCLPQNSQTTPGRESASSLWTNSIWFSSDFCVIYLWYIICSIIPAIVQYFIINFYRLPHCGHESSFCFFCSWVFECFFK